MYSGKYAVTLEIVRKVEKAYLEGLCTTDSIRQFLASEGCPMSRRNARRYLALAKKNLKKRFEKDAERAREIAQRDDEIDALYHKVLQQCISNMVADSNNVTLGIRLIWVGHKLERIADRVTNICERVTFTVTGKIEELDSL